MVRTIETSFGTLIVELRGSGTPLVLLHSGGHDRRDFEAIVPALARRFQTVTVDLPGHGASSYRGPIEGLRASELCAATLELLEALELPPAILLGNSVGGMACLHVATQAPARVRALVLVSPSGLVEQTWLARAFCRLQGRVWVRRRFGLLLARAYLRTRGPEARALLSRIAASRNDPRHVAMEAALWRSFGEPDSDLSAAIDRVRCPVELVWGRHDPVLRARVEGARARALLPHARFHELDAGHVPYVEDPVAFLRVVEPLLAELDGAVKPAVGPVATSSVPVAPIA